MSEEREPDRGEGEAAGEHPDRPRVPVRIEEAFAAAAMALVVVITFANVIVRYFTNVSFAFTEEVSVFLMVVMALFGAAAAFANNRHIRMDFLLSRMPRALGHRVELAIMAISAALFAALAWYGTRLFLDDWQFGTTSPGIGVPQWIYTLWLPLLALLIALRILGRLVRLLRWGPRAR